MTDKKLQGQLKSLIAKKEQYFIRIQNLYDLLKRLDDRKSIDNFLSRYKTLNETKNLLTNTLDSINQIQFELDDKFEPDYKLLNSCDEMICEIEYAKDKLGHNNTDSHTKIPHLKLPKFQLCSFSGDLKEWPIFYETFKTAIHDNSSLCDSERIQYLIGKLHGRALETISSIPATEYNYAIIWQTLLDKYEDKRKLALSYISQMFNFSAIKSESFPQLNQFLEKFANAYEALKRLDIEDLADFIVLHLASSKLDEQTFKYFEMSDSIRGKQFPAFQDLVQFLKEQVRILERVQGNPAIKSKTHSANVSKSHSFFTTRKLNESKPAFTVNCALCKGEQHQLYRCEKFLGMSPIDRHKLIKLHRRCFNCLSSLHQVPNCRSSSSCNVCQKKHHSLIHLNATAPPEAIVEVSEKEPGIVSCYGSLTNKTSSVLLSTAVVKVKSVLGKWHKLRFLLDSGSQTNLLTDKCCRELGLKTEKMFSSIQGIGNIPTKITSKVTITFTPHFDTNLQYTLDFLTVNKIAENVPSVHIDMTNLPHLKNLILADETFYKPGPIDGIIGAELYPYLLRNVQVSDPTQKCVAIDTSLGYVVMGRAPTAVPNAVENIFSCFYEHSTEPSLEKIVEKFWNVEEVPQDTLSPSFDDECESIFVKTHSRDAIGRYIVDLPFKDDPSKLGNSSEVAKRRFFLLERRFTKIPGLKEKYSAEIQKLLDNNYLSISNGDDGYFLPHHAVVKEHSESTPVRIVFDASAKTNSGLSLNDILHVGPKMHTDCFGLLLRFRLFKHAMTADVRQMYSRILVNPLHCKYQKILWRFNAYEPLQTYQFNRVTFGVTSSPFLALRTVQQLALDEGARFPLAKVHVPTDMFVDDLVCSVPSVEYGCNLHKEAVELFASGGFELVKWSTNNPDILHNIPEQMRKMNSISFDHDNASKVLGLIWKPQTDEFSFQFKLTQEGCTKRTMLSTIARIFDPIGFLGPVLLYTKCLIKELWSKEIGWDEPPPEEITKKFEMFVAELHLLSDHAIPRHVNIEKNCTIWLVGFCDGSNAGYGAVVYIRVSDPNGIVSVNLFAAKSRVTPIKKCLTTPRIELSSACLLSNLIRSVKSSITQRISIDRIVAFSDSTITLGRIKNLNTRSDVFVKNRVTQIRENLDPKFWLHVSTADNPADCLSRGLLPRQLLENSLWWHGPHWLIKHESQWPITFENNAFVDPEADEICNAVVEEVDENDNVILTLISRCSTWRKLLKTVAFVLRFVGKSKNRSFPLDAEELNNAEITIILSLQNKFFANDLKLIKSGADLKSAIGKLRPFIDKYGLLRVGGRLSNSQADYNQKHPILLPKKCVAVDLLIRHYHIENLHTGPSLLHSLLRSKYWLLGARSAIRKIIRNCNLCFRARPKSSNPFMADLPLGRVQPSAPFSHTGVDYAGPFHITLKRARGQRTQKAYLCLFICLSTKALHLELAPDLSTQSFLNAFKRFVSRRGLCDVIYSDQGTNFVGAKGYMAELYDLIDSSEYKAEFAKEFADNRIRWQLNPPSAPHFGGLWESNVKAVKSHLFKVIGKQILCVDEFVTVLTQIEALLNSRPLSLMSEDPSELECLTPSHFLLGKPLRSLPSVDFSKDNVNSLTRPALLDAIVQQYWKRWHIEYLHTLQSRNKWSRETPPIHIGTVVLIMDENAPPLKWLLGRVTQVLPGKDGVIRVAQVQTANGSYTRPVCKLCPLPTQ